MPKALPLFEPPTRPRRRPSDEGPAGALVAALALTTAALPARRVVQAVVLACVALFAAAPAVAQAPAGVPAMKEPIAAAAEGRPGRAGEPRTINWEALVPAGWDPFKDFKGTDFQLLQDGDPRAMQMLKRMREAWDNAPANPKIVGQSVRIPGFVVPLEEGKEGLAEFLLVPYFGACIHSPPPPANQIIHVLPRSPAKGVKSMDAVWIHGRITSQRIDSFMGAAGYRIEAEGVTPYVEKAGK
ncbi:MAG: DUF3299 domain-containing protein [Rubrivivax sp.]|nr:DUF3299 domain-containing protein [Rubrivivax sp.]